MARRPEASFPKSDGEETAFSSLHFIDEQLDGAAYSNFKFEFCTIEKIGMKGAKFSHCVFRHCEFIDCYLAHAEFEHCQFTGSFFDRCVFSWAKFPNSALDYTNFLNCGPVLSQIIEHKPKDPQSAAKLFRNLASEHNRLGNWEEVDKYLIESYKERERHFWYVVSGKNDHYRSRYSGLQRLSYFMRYIGYKAAGKFLGYGVSWSIFGRTILLFGFIIFPVVNYVFSRGLGDDENSVLSARQSTNLTDILSYLNDLFTVTIRSFFPFVPSPAEGAVSLTIPFWLSSIEAAFGTAMMAVFAALLFRWASKGA